ncbi:MAG: hypothetical protein JW837_13775 [Sedimentisphaerales bacterium]|nr:hypothetical protein [Sedimentisphaerales bacterium]
MRKFYIGLISLAVVMVLYMLYSRLDTTTPPDAGRRVEFVDSIKDSNDVDLKKQISRISDVGVGNIEKARYIARDRNQKVEREWGFERLLNESRDMWEIEKPFMNIYQRNFTCYITADNGKVQVVTAVGKSTPKDATFTSNVVIHIVPAGLSNIRESRIYLDDITYLSEKSLLSTANSVKFVSEDARMTGKGLELVYDDVLERLEYLWIKDLESLHIKNSKMNTLSGPKSPPRKPADTDAGTKIRQPEEAAVASDNAETQNTFVQPPPEREKGENYKCLFSKNVLIDGPEQMVFAHNEIFIDDIIFSKTSGSEPNKAVTDTMPASADRSDDVVVTATDMRGPDEFDADNVAAAESVESSDKLRDVTITCDNGFIIALKDYPKIFEKIPKTDTDLNASDRPRPEKLDLAEGRKTFLAPEIDYNALTGDIISSGASEMKFYTVDLGPGDANRPALPVTVTAKKQVRFLQTSNQAVFEGDCRCDMFQTDPNFRQQYILLAPKLTIALAEDANEKASSLAPGIEHFTADGGLVRLFTLKTAGRTKLGGTKLESSKFDYDPGKGLFEATGPGMIVMDNSKISSSEAEDERFSLRRPCYAVVREYDTLKYFIPEKRIVADAGSQGLIIDYFPIVDGEYQHDRQATVYTPHIEANLTETDAGQLKLLTLSATDGIVYKDKQNKQFDGSTLFYDADKSVVTIQGDELRPCQYNGAYAGAIEWDLKTDKIKTEIVGPAILQLK